MNKKCTLKGTNNHYFDRYIEYWNWQYRGDNQHFIQSFITLNGKYA